MSPSPEAMSLPLPSRLRLLTMLAQLDAASLVMAAAAAALFFLVLYPLFWLFYGSFTYGDQLAPAAALEALWQLPGLSRALANTFLLLVGAVPLSFVFALPLVWIVTRTDTPLKGLIEVAAILPFITPPLIGAVAWALLAAPRTGLINLLARQIGASAPILNIYSMSGLIFVMSLYVSPYVFITVQAVMQRMDASLEDASLISGASVAKTVWNVLLPLSLPAILSAAILVITRVLEEFAIPGVLGAPTGIYTITTYIYYQAISYVPPRYEIAALLASLFMAATGILLALQARILGGRGSFTTVSGKGRPPRVLRLGAWRYATLAYALIYLGLAVALPYAVLLYAAFVTKWDAPPALANLTLANFASTFAAEMGARAGLFNSLLLALSGATLATALTLVISAMIHKGRPWVSGVLEFVSSIPLAMPGPVLAVALLWAYLHEPFVLYGTLWILLVAYMTHYLPYGVRAIGGSFRQLSGDFERAAAACGASRIAGFRDILLPLLRPGILAGWMLMFVSMIRELSSSIFLFVPGTETTAVVMLEMWQESRFSGVAVLSLTLIAISLCVVILVRWVAGTAHMRGD
jgi:iron(III) transport system permease protein